jgi:hypothetical protein
MWVESILLFGPKILKTVPVIALASWKSKRGVLLFLVIIASVSTILFFHLDLGDLFLLLPRYGLHILFTLYIVNLLRFLQPPAVIVLTSARSHLLIETVSHSFFPHRSIAMISEKKFVGAMFFSNQTDNLRAFDQANWEKIVQSLVDVTPIIVVDTRVPGKSLVWETGLMLDPIRVDKAMFLTGLFGEKPALDANKDKIGNSKLFLTTEKMLPIHLAVCKQNGRIPKMTP